jgi:tRNA (Thr-GGU) A37 N-methylase
MAKSRVVALQLENQGAGALATIELDPIGFIRGGRSEPIDDDWDAVSSTIVLDAERFSPDAIASLDEFSHIEVVFHFHAAREAQTHFGARRPRGRADWPLVGIFAQRGKDRPNHLGVTACRLVAIDGLMIKVRGLDAIDGTPVLDIKPVMREFLPRGKVVQPAWASELMQGYWKA